MRIQPVSPVHPDAATLLDALSDTLATITGDSGRSSFDPADVAGPGAAFVVAYEPSGRPVGCGAFRPLSEEVAEVKRMYARPGSKGVGAAIIGYLEAAAAHHGYRELWLETRAVNLRAVAFYERHGYGRIPNFGSYVGRPEAVCFAKRVL